MTLSKGTVADLLTTAIEGGSNYWYEFLDLDMVYDVTSHMINYPVVDRIIEAIYNHGVSIIVTDVVTGDIIGKLDLESIENGEKVVSESYPEYFNEILCENEDAYTADIWFQCCVLGKVIYA